MICDGHTSQCSCLTKGVKTVLQPMILPTLGKTCSNFIHSIAFTRSQATETAVLRLNPNISPFLMVKPAPFMSELAVSSMPGTGRDLPGRWAGEADDDRHTSGQHTGYATTNSVGTHQTCSVYGVYIKHTHMLYILYMYIYIYVYVYIYIYIYIYIHIYIYIYSTVCTHLVHTCDICAYHTHMMLHYICLRVLKTYHTMCL